MDINILEQGVNRLWLNREDISPKEHAVINEVIDLLDNGTLRVAEAVDGKWQTNEWVKKAILLYFQINKGLDKEIKAGDLKFYDRIPLKNKFVGSGYRVVPSAIARYGSYLAKGVVLMPSYVNIGAYVDSNTMVDTWATVGSCAQTGKNVHLSGGVGIGGVLEPPQAAPVIIEDGVFVGSRCIIVEGVHVESEAVLGANTVITASTKIIDVSQKEVKEYKGIVPARSVVIPGSYEKKFPGGSYNVPCSLIIGKRKETTEKKTSINDVLRDYKISI
ncbi:MAG: 2,3,4,5-tetrahydropyridine-2,6-dicarboxylate N-succinyltransferase [Solitalea-like symbiont of Acarus siro]